MINALDYQIPVTQLSGWSGKCEGDADMQAAKVPILHSPQQRHLTSIYLFAKNFLKDGPIWKICGLKINIDNQNKIALTLLQNQKCGR